MLWSQSEAKTPQPTDAVSVSSSECVLRSGCCCCLWCRSDCPAARGGNCQGNKIPHGDTGVEAEYKQHNDNNFTCRGQDMSSKCNSLVFDTYQM